jgi:hypothetical protein
MLRCAACLLGHHIQRLFVLAACLCLLLLPVHTQVFPYHLRLRGAPSPHTAAIDRGLWICKPFYTGDNGGGVIYATWPELQVIVQTLKWLGFALLQVTALVLGGTGLGIKSIPQCNAQ